MAEPRLRVLVVEDEPLSRASLCAMVEADPRLALIGQAGEGHEALRRIEALKPDLLFLDVELPGLDGLQILHAATHLPCVVFTTAYDDYAVRAFEHEAVDYLLKPFGRRRFEAAVERSLRRAAARPDAHGRARPASGHGDGAGPAQDALYRLYAREGRRIVPIDVAACTHFEAAGDYVRVHTRRGTQLVAVRIATLAERLDPGKFVRVHRSHIVNLDHVTSIHPEGDRRLRLEMRDGTTVVSSRAGTRRLRARMA